MSDLAAKTCVPCRGGVPPLKGEELAALETQVGGWNVIEEHHITKTFKFPDFREALKFVNHVGELVEEQGHHPDISLAWGKVEITTWTHKIKGLTESDFILAAKNRPALQTLNPALCVNPPIMAAPRCLFFRPILEARCAGCRPAPRNARAEESGFC
jgi:4a-hydroxytetrahydrobiopterin dehydratase